MCYSDAEQLNSYLAQDIEESARILASQPSYFLMCRKLLERCVMSLDIIVFVLYRGGGEATRSGTEKRCSHNLQSGQSAG